MNDTARAFFVARAFCCRIVNLVVFMLLCQNREIRGGYGFSMAALAVFILAGSWSFEKGPLEQILRAPATRLILYACSSLPWRV